MRVGIISNKIASVGRKAVGTALISGMTLFGHTTTVEAQTAARYASKAKTAMVDKALHPDVYQKAYITNPAKLAAKTFEQTHRLVNSNSEGKIYEISKKELYEGILPNRKIDTTRVIQGYVFKPINEAEPKTYMYQAILNTYTCEGCVTKYTPFLTVKNNALTEFDYGITTLPNGGTASYFRYRAAKLEDGTPKTQESIEGLLFPNDHDQFTYSCGNIKQKPVSKDFVNDKMSIWQEQNKGVFYASTKGIKNVEKAEMEIAQNAEEDDAALDAYAMDYFMSSQGATNQLASDRATIDAYAAKQRALNLKKIEAATQDDELIIKNNSDKAQERNNVPTYGRVQQR